MDLNTINGIIRAIVPAVLSFIVAKGWITESMVGEITAAIVTLVAAGWSVKTNYNKKPQ